VAWCGCRPGPKEGIRSGLTEGRGMRVYADKPNLSSRPRYRMYTGATTSVLLRFSRAQIPTVLANAESSDPPRIFKRSPVIAYCLLRHKSFQNILGATPSLREADCKLIWV